MSLRVWLPLTDGTLKQQGLSNSVVTSSGTVVLTNAGKLGKCATFGSAAGGLTIPASAMTSFTNACSVAFWLKINGWGNSYDTYFQAGLGSSPWAHYIFGFLRNNANSTICFTISNGTNASNANYLSSALSTGVWYHVALTYETGKCKIYLNGSLDHEYSTSIVPNFSGITKITLGRCNNSSYQTQCGMNDVRIYDHCLSPLEVKEISQGLVLHYPLNGYLGSAPNLLSKYVTPGQSAPGSTSTAGRTNYYGNYGIIIPATENADTYFRLFLNKQLESGKTYTISCNVSGLLSGSYYRFPLFAQSNTSMGVLDLNHNGLCSLTFTMNWTGTQTAVSKDGRNIYVCFLDDSGRAIASGQGPITVTNFKIEEGSVVTPFSPDFYDVGLDTTKITDESGFGYNGTVTGTLNYNSDSQRYNVSAHFNGSTYIHLTPPTAEIKTFSVWVNWDSIPSGQSVVLVDNGSQMGLGLMSTGILCSTSGAGNSYTFSKSSLVANTWYHFVVVETGTTTRKLYINGVEQSPTSNTSNWTYSVNELQLGKRSTTSDGFIGKLSDFRAYATALSEADIKALYNTSANIDNLGNFHSFEFVEDLTDSIYKNGITSTGIDKTYLINNFTKTGNTTGWSFGGTSSLSNGTVSLTGVNPTILSPTFTVGANDIICFSGEISLPTPSTSTGGAGLYLGTPTGTSTDIFIYNWNTNQWTLNSSASTNPYFIYSYNSSTIYSFKTYVVGSNITIDQLPKPSANSTRDLRALKLNATTITRLRSGYNTNTSMVINLRDFEVYNINQYGMCEVDSTSKRGKGYIQSNEFIEK